jgi:hypothetical protein
VLSCQVTREDQDQEAIAYLRMLVDAYDCDEEAAVLRCEQEAQDEQGSDSDTSTSNSDSDAEGSSFQHTVFWSQVRLRCLITDQVEECFGAGRKSFKSFDANLWRYFKKYFPNEIIDDGAICVCIFLIIKPIPCLQQAGPGLQIAFDQIPVRGGLPRMY